MCMCVFMKRKSNINPSNNQNNLTNHLHIMNIN